MDEQVINSLAEQIKEVHDKGVEVCIVVGGGNIFRGAKEASKGLNRSVADQVGMLATVMNALYLQNALEKMGTATRVLSGINIPSVCENYIYRRALRHLEKNRVIIFAGGTGNPYFTTDTGSSLRGIEIEAEVMMKGTRVDGVYTADPEKDPTATKFDEITYDEVLQRGLKVMDITATAMCKENKLPIYVFNMDVYGNLEKVLNGEPIGTLVY
jgi:uridylate kinase